MIGKDSHTKRPNISPQKIEASTRGKPGVTVTPSHVVLQDDQTATESTPSTIYLPPPSVRVSGMKRKAYSTSDVTPATENTDKRKLARVDVNIPIPRPVREARTNTTYQHKDAIFGTWPTRDQAASRGTWRP